MPKDNGIYIGYWKDNLEKVYAVSYTGAINNLDYCRSFGIDSEEYQTYVLDIWVEHYDARQFNNEDEAYEYAHKLNAKWKTEHGVCGVGDFAFPIPKKVKLRVFK